MKKGIILMALAFLYGSAQAQKHPEELVNAYLKVKEALVKSDHQQAALLAASWLKVIESETSFKEKDQLIKAVQKIAKTGDINAQRVALADASRWTWQMVNNAHHFHKDVYYQYCPMNKTYWLSAEPDIRNPYYGSTMLTCGQVVDKKLN